MTPGSWWKHPRTGARLVVPKYIGGYLTLQHDPKRRHPSGRYCSGWFHAGPGQPEGRLPAFQEGEKMHLAWLFPEELASVWRHYRPSSKGAVPLQPWITNPIGDMNDFLYNDEAGLILHVSILDVRGNVVGIVGMDPVVEKFTSWAECRYTTLFLTTSEARIRLRPKYATLKPTAWDRIEAVE